MAHADKDAQKAVAIEIAREYRNALATTPFALFPICATFPVEMRTDETLISGEIGLVIRFAIEAIEAGIIWQMLQGAQFQTVEGNMGAVEVYSLYRCRISR